MSCYTDGSRLEGRSGAAYFTDHELIRDGQFPLGNYPTVFQAEIFASLKLAFSLTEVSENQRKPVNLYVDSLSALQSLNSQTYVPGLVRECHSALNALGESRSVTLLYTGYLHIAGTQEMKTLMV